jgi:hypothetical protein
MVTGVRRETPERHAIRSQILLGFKSATGVNPDKTLEQNERDHQTPIAVPEP